MEEGELPNLSREILTTLIPKSVKDNPKEKKMKENYRPISH